ncbi:MAG: hypothetical protein LBN27_11620 [Prevotellaceae bacterium]|jgi:antitoxin component YwqK of YwqJK toxin-antitoxin module|nr:hypothetical protein [Prevotellaceae bacterium]
MKKITVIAAFLGIFLIINAQNHTDKNGKKQGQWVKYYDNGNKLYEGVFKDDRPIGEFFRYYDNGKIKSRQNFGDKTETELYNTSGKLFAKGAYIGTKKDGEWLYYSSKGEPFFKEIYTNGVRNGVSTLYDEDGNVFETITWQDGKMNGKHVRYFPNGQMQLEIEYKNNLRDGASVSYFDNGKKESEGVFENDKKNGVWTYCKNDGTVDFTAEYLNGENINQKALDKQQQQQIDENDRNAGKVEDPANYVNNPEEYIR